MELAAALLFAALFAPLGASAQSFPERPITLIVPWSAGGTTDVALRALADSTSKHLGQRLAVENRAGAWAPRRRPLRPEALRRGEGQHRAARIKAVAR